MVTKMTKATARQRARAVHAEMLERNDKIIQATTEVFLAQEEILRQRRLIGEQIRLLLSYEVPTVQIAEYLGMKQSEVTRLAALAPAGSDSDSDSDAAAAPDAER